VDDFLLGLLDQQRGGIFSEAKPIYQIVASVTRPCLSVADLRFLNRYGHLHQMPFAQSSTEMGVADWAAHPSPPTKLFIEPVVVEVVGAGFNRPANERLLTLRFPRIIKIHRDRTFRDSLDFAEYQRLAQESMAYMLKEDAKGKSAFLMKLRAADRGWQRQVARAASPLQGSEPACSTSTPSTDSGTEKDDDDETETSDNENRDEDLTVSSCRYRARKRSASPEHFPDLVAACKKVKGISMNSEKVGDDGETTSASLRLTMNQMLNGKTGETCNLQPAQAAQDVSFEERASVS
jgi:hypothetical protein